MAYLTKNNAVSTLGATLTAVATTMTVATSTGDRFPTVAGSDFTHVTLEDAAGNIEIVKVTARAGGGDSMTIERAQEGTSARAWAIGDIVELRPTAGTVVTLEGAQTLKNKTISGADNTLSNIPNGAVLGLGALALKNTVATADIDADSVTYAKIQNVSATDKLLGRSTAGAGDVEEITCTAAGRALLDDASATAQRATLGATATGDAVFIAANAAAARAAIGAGTDLGYTPVNKAGDTLTGTIGSTVNVLTDAASIAWNMATSHIAKVTLGGNRTVAAPTNQKDGNFILHVIQDGTGSRTLSWNSAFKWPLGVAPTLSTTPGARDVFSFTIADGLIIGSMLKGVA